MCSYLSVWLQTSPAAVQNVVPTTAQLLSGPEVSMFLKFHPFHTWAYYPSGPANMFAF